MFRGFNCWPFYLITTTVSEMILWGKFLYVWLWMSLHNAHYNAYILVDNLCQYLWLWLCAYLKSEYYVCGEETFHTFEIMINYRRFKIYGVLKEILNRKNISYKRNSISFIHLNDISSRLFDKIIFLHLKYYLVLT